MSKRYYSVRRAKNEGGMTPTRMSPVRGEPAKPVGTVVSLPSSTGSKPSKPSPKKVKGKKPGIADSFRTLFRQALPKR